MSNNLQRQDSTESLKNVPFLCIGNCGFFGNAATNKYCSLCFKKKQQQQQQDQKSNKMEVEQPKKHKHEEQEEEHVHVEKIAKKELLVHKEVEELKPKKKKKKKSLKKRCTQCKKKLPLLKQFTCRCEKVFCSNHRMAYVHDCPVSTKKINQEQIEKSNPLIMKRKVELI